VDCHRRETLSRPEPAELPRGGCHHRGRACLLVVPAIRQPKVPAPSAKTALARRIDAFPPWRDAKQKLNFRPTLKRSRYCDAPVLILSDLPPNAAEVEAFLGGTRLPMPTKAARPFALLPALRRTLAHWLDIAGYADSDGYSDPIRREVILQYRYYVIRSFNADNRSTSLSSNNSPAMN